MKHNNRISYVVQSRYYQHMRSLHYCIRAHCTYHFQNKKFWERSKKFQQSLNHLVVQYDKRILKGKFLNGNKTFVHIIIYCSAYLIIALTVLLICTGSDTLGIAFKEVLPPPPPHSGSFQYMQANTAIKSGPKYWNVLQGRGVVCFRERRKDHGFIWPAQIRSNIIS